MSGDTFIKLAKQTVLKYVMEHINPKDELRFFNADDVFLVWYCKTLQNHKALLYEPTFDKMYYEFTYNGDCDEAYLDVYAKTENRVVKPHD